MTSDDGVAPSWPLPGQNGRAFPAVISSAWLFFSVVGATSSSGVWEVSNHGFCHEWKVRIGYEVEGIGEPLLMVHGFSANIGMWREMGYVDALVPNHRLILVDPRGHGQSDKPHDPAQYRPELMAGDIVAVLDHLGIDRAHFMGASMGAAIGFEVARRVPHRFLSLILQGYGRYGPLTELQQRFQAMGLMMEQMAATQAAEPALASIEPMIGPMSAPDRTNSLPTTTRRSWPSWSASTSGRPSIAICPR